MRTACPDLIVSNTASNTVTVTLNTSSLPVSSDAAPTAYPASEYVDLGLKVTATPRIHPGDEVTLRLQFEISALSGSDINGIPIIGNRSVDQVVRLRESQTSILAGMIQSNEFRSFTGANPFSLFSGTLARRDSSDSNTELLIAITPREIRLGPRPGRTLYAGRGEGPTAAPAGPGTPIDAPAGPQPAPQQPPGAVQPQGAPTELPPPPVVQPEALPPDINAPTPGGEPVPERCHRVLPATVSTRGRGTASPEERTDVASILTSRLRYGARASSHSAAGLTPGLPELPQMIVVIPKRFTARDLLFVWPSTTPAAVPAISPSGKDD